VSQNAISLLQKLDFVEHHFFDTLLMEAVEDANNSFTGDVKEMIIIFRLWMTAFKNVNSQVCGLTV